LLREGLIEANVLREPKRLLGREGDPQKASERLEGVVSRVSDTTCHPHDIV